MMTWNTARHVASGDADIQRSCADSSRGDVAAADPWRMQAAKHRRWDVLCVGAPCAHNGVAVDRPPAGGGMGFGRPLGIDLGGAAANVACAVSRLGWNSAMLGLICDDANGRLCRASFAHFQVDAEMLEVIDRGAADCKVAPVASGGRRATMRVPLPNTLQLRRGMSQSRLVYAKPGDAEELSYIGSLARAEGTILAVDMERAFAPNEHEMRRCLAPADIVFFDEESFLKAMGLPPSPYALASLLADRPRTVVVTRGGAGAVAADRTGFTSHPAFDRIVVDPAGAGDSFIAAFLCASLAGESIAQAVRFACAAASFTVGALGARAGLPDRFQVNRFLRCSAAPA